MSETTGGEVTTMPYRVARYRLLLVKDGTVPTTWDRQLRQSKDVADLMAPLARGLDRETFWCLLLNGKNVLVGLNVVSVGALTAALVHPREVFKPAILESAASVILIHNHPSGDPTPSREDVRLTRQLVECAKLLDLRIHDHVIIGRGRFASLAERGVI